MLVQLELRLLPEVGDRGECNWGVVIGCPVGGREYGCRVWHIVQFCIRPRDLYTRRKVIETTLLGF